MAHPIRTIRGRAVVGLAAPGRVAAVAALTAATVGLAGAPVDATAGHAGRRVTVEQANLVSDQAGVATIQDPALVNAWGLAAGPTTPLWVVDNGADRATVYNGAQPGTPVGIAAITAIGPEGTAPTGEVFNDTTSFVLATGGKTGTARFIFATEGGDIFAWNNTGDATAMVPVAHTDGAVYKGLALLHQDAGPLLLAANFRSRRIDVFDGQFQPVASADQFRPVGIPPHYAPFNVVVADDQVFVTYAKQDADAEDDVPGRGHGFVNVYTTDGQFTRQLVRRGVLNSPWGMTIAPASFGDLAGTLLVGNFGDGRIYAFDRQRGHLRGTLRLASGAPVRIDGLWALLPGNGVAGTPDLLWFSAGPEEETHGLLGTLSPVG